MLEKKCKEAVKLINSKTDFFVFKMDSILSNMTDDYLRLMDVEHDFDVLVPVNDKLTVEEIANRGVDMCIYVVMKRLNDLV